VDEYSAQLLPADKVRRVEAIIEAKPRGSSVVFVGDGINDAPVLARSDVGVAMGALGSDAAVEAADVVLMDDDPSKVYEAVRASRRTLAIVKQNIVFALGVKLLVLVFAGVGLAPMWLAVFADVGVMLLAVLNAMRALKQ
jgi:Cd2+/Zn2+-exporting ATPase